MKLVANEMNFHQFESPSRSLEPPNLNKDFDDAALPSINQDFSTKSSAMLKVDDHAVDAHGEHGGELRYPVTTIDFGRVETPFIIGVWILFASIAKIGE